MKYIVMLLAVLSLTACASKPQYEPQPQQPPVTYAPRPSVIVIQSQPAPQYVVQAIPQVMPQVHYVMPTYPQPYPQQYQQQYQQQRMVPNPAYIPEQ